MDEKRCWFCRRGKRELIEELPEGFWDEHQEMFFDVEVIGKVSGVDKVRPGDVPHSRHFRRRGAPEDEVHSFDDRRFAIVGRKCMKVSVCRVCRSLETALTSVAEEGRGNVPYRVVYAPAAEELAVARCWERFRTEEKKLEADYPDDAYRVLLAIQRLYAGAPVTLWDLSEELNVFNHRSLERPVTHLLGQSPGIGVLDRKTLTLHLTDEGGKTPMVDELVERYEEFYRQREVSVAVPEVPEHGNEILARIKKLNYPDEAQQHYSRW
ncbi:MAG: hypothetical protein ISF22_00960 [Methanomassiliicoccus sp.]|nr:hypothetical protein [Methanomassiliicoccus sp.]